MQEGRLHGWGRVESRLEHDQPLPSADSAYLADMVSLERIIDYDEQGLTAELAVRGDGLFGDDQTVPAWAGIEYMAQAIAAYVGVKARQANEPIAWFSPNTGFSSDLLRLRWRNVDGTR